MEQVLEGNIDQTTFIIQTGTTRDNNNVHWKDVSANDYIYRPNALEHMCIFEQIMWFRKRFRKKESKKSNKKTDEAVDLSFGHDHPGHKFAYLEKNKHFKVPMTSFPKEALCQIKDLELALTDLPDANVMEKRELYAKTALLLFCPLRSLQDIQVDGSYWKKFDQFRKWHFNLDANVFPGTEVHQKFYERGFEILHNIDTRLTVEKCQGRAMDPVTKVTTFDVTEDEQNKKRPPKQDNDDYDIRPIIFFC